MAGKPWRWLFGWRVLAFVATERRTAGPSATLGMTKFKWPVNLGVGYSDGGFRKSLRPKAVSSSSIHPKALKVCQLQFSLPIRDLSISPPHALWARRDDLRFASARHGSRLQWRESNERRSVRQYISSLPAAGSSTPGSSLCPKYRGIYSSDGTGTLEAQLSTGRR